MAEVLVQNLRDPDQMVNIIVTIRKVVVPEQGTGEQVWVLDASTEQKDASGDDITPVRKIVSSNDTLTEDVNDLITEMCLKIPWTYEPDTEPPEVVSQSPLAGATEVSVDTSILITLQEVAPSSGIDLSSIELYVKGFDLTDQLTITGDLRTCAVSVTPGTKYKSAIRSS